MKDVLQQTQTWRDAGQPMAVVTVVDTWGSAPRPVGAKLVATADGLSLIHISEPTRPY